MTGRRLESTSAQGRHCGAPHPATAVTRKPASTRKVTMGIQPTELSTNDVHEDEPYPSRRRSPVGRRPRSRWPGSRADKIAIDLPRRRDPVRADRGASRRCSPSCSASSCTPATRSRTSTSSTSRPTARPTTASPGRRRSASRRTPATTTSPSGSTARAPRCSWPPSSTVVATSSASWSACSPASAAAGSTGSSTSSSTCSCRCRSSWSPWRSRRSSSSRFGQQPGKLVFWQFAVAAPGAVAVRLDDPGPPGARRGALAARARVRQAARVIGVPTRRILFKELLPNLIAPIIVSISLGLPAFVTAEAGLAFLGIGVVGVPVLGPDDQQGRQLLQHLSALPLRARAGDPHPRHGAEPPRRRRPRRLRPQDSPVITPAERASTSRERWVHLDAYEETSRGSCHSCSDDARCLWWWQREHSSPSDDETLAAGRQRRFVQERRREGSCSPSRTTPREGGTFTVLTNQVAGDARPDAGLLHGLDGDPVRPGASVR